MKDAKFETLRYDNMPDAILGAIGLATANYQPLRILNHNGAVALGEKALAQQIELAKGIQPTDLTWQQLQNRINEAATKAAKQVRFNDRVRAALARHDQEQLERTPGYGTFS
jgi:hypothetical protein